MYLRHPFARDRPQHAHQRPMNCILGSIPFFTKSKVSVPQYVFTPPIRKGQAATCTSKTDELYIGKYSLLHQDQKFVFSSMYLRHPFARDRPQQAQQRPMNCILGNIPFFTKIKTICSEVCIYPTPPQGAGCNMHNKDQCTIYWEIFLSSLRSKLFVPQYIFIRHLLHGHVTRHNKDRCT